MGHPPNPARQLSGRTAVSATAGFVPARVAEIFAAAAEGRLGHDRDFLSCDESGRSCRTAAGPGSVVWGGPTALVFECLCGKRSGHAAVNPTLHDLLRLGDP